LPLCPSSPESGPAGTPRPAGTVAHTPVMMEGVSTWAEFEVEAPDVAAFARRLWPGVIALDRGDSVPTGVASFAVAYLATVRRDGAPRLHPFCPIIAGGRLFAAIPNSSPKGHDLRRDPRCVIHAMPGPDDDELCIRASANEVAADIETTALVRNVVARSGVGGMAESATRDPLFEFDLRQVDVATWVNIGQPGTHAVRRQWRAT
jgi:Pyridoxamine 5'-phosphate oxidase